MLAGVARPSPFAVFRNRNFRLLWTSQLISTIGTALNTLAASILVYHRKGVEAAEILRIFAASASLR